jgi:hypothetical protein
VDDATMKLRIDINPETGTVAVVSDEIPLIRTSGVDEAVWFDLAGDDLSDFDFAMVRAIVTLSLQVAMLSRRCRALEGQEPARDPLDEVRETLDRFFPTQRVRLWRG